jgi:hypothetical protein
MINSPGTGDLRILVLGGTGSMSASWCRSFTRAATRSLPPSLPTAAGGRGPAVPFAPGGRWLAYDSHESGAREVNLQS